MTQAPALETMQLQIVSCETCDQIFLLSPRRQTCPGCGGPAGVEFFTFDVGPEGVHLTDTLTNGIAPPAASPSSAEEPALDQAGVPEVPGETSEFHGECPSCAEVASRSRSGVASRNARSLHFGRDDNRLRPPLDP